MTYPDFPKGGGIKKTGLLDDGRAALLILLRLPLLQVGLCVLQLIQERGATFYQIAVGGFEIACVPWVGNIARKKPLNLRCRESRIFFHQLSAQYGVQIADIIVLHTEYQVETRIVIAGNLTRCVWQKQVRHGFADIGAQADRCRCQSLRWKWHTSLSAPLYQALPPTPFGA